MLVIVMCMVPTVASVILMVSNRITVLFVDDFQTDVDYLGNKKGT